MGTVLPFMAMVIAGLAQSSNMVVSKAAMSGGLNKYILVLYSNLISSLIFVPFCIFYYRSQGAQLTLSLVWKLLLLAIVGYSGQICGYVGIDYSSPTMGTAMLNLVPAFTFLFAIAFRMERLDCRSISTIAKTVGTLLSIFGAFVVTFFKGPPIINTTSAGTILIPLRATDRPTWILGGFFLTADAFLGALWYIWQTVILRKCSALVLLTFYFSFSTILSTLFSLFMVQDLNAWKLRYDMGLVAVLYSACIYAVFRVSLIAWCLNKCGPLYVTMFKPIGIVFAVVLGVTFLGDVLYLGSLIGAVIIVSGFYAVMWGKAKEKKSDDNKWPIASMPSSQKDPLLHKMDNV